MLLCREQKLGNWRWRRQKWRQSMTWARRWLNHWRRKRFRLGKEWRLQAVGVGVCVCVCVASEDDWITDEGKGSGWVRKGDCKQWVCVLLQISQKPITLRDHYRVFYSSCAYTDMCMHMRTHPYMHIHAHIHTHLYTYTHTHFASTWCDSETWWQLTRPRARSPNDFFVLLCAAET